MGITSLFVINMLKVLNAVHLLLSACVNLTFVIKVEHKIEKTRFITRFHGF